MFGLALFGITCLVIGEISVKLAIELLALWAAFTVLMLVLSYRALKRSEPYLSVLREKGYCDEFISAFRKVCIDVPKPQESNKVRLASYLQIMGRYDEAFAVMNTVGPEVRMLRSDRFLYVNDYTALNLAVYNTAEAANVFAAEGKFMFSNCKINRKMGACWKDNYLTLLTQQGRFAEAEQYFNAEFRPLDKNDLLYYAALMSLAEGAVYNGLEDRAAYYADAARKYLDSIKEYECSWTRQFYLDRLEVQMNRAADMRKQRMMQQY